VNGSLNRIAQSLRIDVSPASPRRETEAPEKASAGTSHPLSAPAVGPEMDRMSTHSHGSDEFVTPDGTPVSEREQDFSMPGGLTADGDVFRKTSTKRKKKRRSADQAAAKATQADSVNAEGFGAMPGGSQSFETASKADSDTITVRNASISIDEMSASTSGSSMTNTAADSEGVLPGALPVSSPDHSSVTASTPSDAASLSTNATTMSVASPLMARPDLHEKMLPLPPPREIPEMVPDDPTPLAGPGRSTMPSFGVNLIPPTPPALPSRESYGLVSSAPSGALAMPLMEEGEVSQPQSAVEMPRSVPGTNAGSSPQLGSGHVYRRSVDESALFTGAAAAAVPGSGLNRARSVVSNSSTDLPLVAPLAMPVVAAFMEPPGRRLSTSIPASPLSSTGTNSPAPPTVPYKDLREEALQSLTLPPRAGTKTGTDSSNSSDSPSISPAPSASGRSSRSQLQSASSSEISPSPSPGPYQRKMRQHSHGALGVTRPMELGAISEWESSMPSPIKAAAPLITPATNFSQPFMAPRSVSSVDTGASPDLIKSAPMGAPASSFLENSLPVARQSLDSLLGPTSLDGHQYRPDAPPSNYSSSVASHSVASLPIGPVSGGLKATREIRKISAVADESLHTRTTMTTIAVTSGAKRQKRSKERDAGDNASVRGSGDFSGLLQEELATVRIQLTAHTPPPRKISSTQLLIQVIAVAIDEIDRMIVRGKLQEGTGVGFVPGRSFCGRAIEVGWEVKDFRKGDMVFGLQEARKVSRRART
jgi:hypothetical protein